jgi:hypothetical protein
MPGSGTSTSVGHTSTEREGGAVAPDRQEEFYRMLEGVVIDDTELFNARLREWGSFYNFNRPMEGSGARRRMRGFAIWLWRDVTAISVSRCALTVLAPSQQIAGVDAMSLVISLVCEVGSSLMSTQGVRG